VWEFLLRVGLPLGVELPGGFISQEVRPDDKMATKKMVTLLLYQRGDPISYLKLKDPLTESRGLDVKKLHHRLLILTA
jgi:hypothetical protein